MTDDLIDAVTHLVSEFCPADSVAQYAQDRFHQRLWTALARADLTTVSVPEDSGGSGGSVKDALQIIRIVGRFAGAVPVAESSLLGGWLLSLAGWQLPDGPLAVGAPGDDEVTVTRLADGSVRLDGVMRNVAWLAEAGELVVLCNDEAEWLVCRAPVATLTVRSGLNIAGEGRDMATLDGLLVPGDRARSIGTAATRLDFRVRGAASRVALMAGALDRIQAMTTSYTGERVQFGQPIRRFQAAQHRLARLAEQAQLAVTCARVLTDADSLVPADVAAAKSVVGIAAAAAAAEAHQLHGAVGMTLEYPLNFLTRRVWSWRNEYGSSEDWNSWLGERLDLAGDVWTELTGT